MDYDEKAVVKIDADGSVLKCAKGMDGGDCGYKAGAKMCGKCGAMAVAMKMVPLDDDEVKEMDEDDELIEKALAAVGDPDMDEDEDEDEDEDAEAPAPTDDEAEADADPEMGDEEEDEDEEMPKGNMRKRPLKYKDDEDGEKAMDDAEMEDDEDDEDDEEDEEESPVEKGGWMDDARKRRLQTMGKKSAEVGVKAFMCAIDRKVYPGSSSMCDDCPGGCMSEKGMPGLIEIEGKAEAEFDGTVIDSGYSQNSDVYVVDLEVKSGAIEVFLEGSTGEVLGFHKLDDSVFEQKSLYDEAELIDFNEACDIAVKSIEGLDGAVMAVEPDTFEGFDCYAVEIDGVDGKSYDVFVALDGEVLGFDQYEADEAEEIEAEAAEIALKRAFNEDQRQEMAKEGLALPDGSFPISTVDDLRNAIMAHGRATDKERAKKHIIKRARAMGRMDMIPASWATGKKDAATFEDADFMASLLEFELLTSEDDSDDGLS